MPNTSRLYKPGDLVPDSGIYRVKHDNHARPHEVTCVKGEPFPPCRECSHPRFVLKYKTKHIPVPVETHKHFKTRATGSRSKGARVILGSMRGQSSGTG